MLNVLSDKSSKIIEEFLQCYSDSSKLQYRSSINRFCETNSIIELADISYSQYQYFEDRDNQQYLLQFIKYLYGHELLKTEDDYPKTWDKGSIIEYYENRKNKIKNQGITIDEKKKNRLDVTKIHEIEEFFNGLSAESVDIVYAFSWFMLFNTDCQIDEFKKMQLNTFDGEYIKNKDNKKYKIPSRFHYFISQRNATSTKLKMTTLDVYIKELGEKFNLNNLLPREIKEAKKLIPYCVLIVWRNIRQKKAIGFFTKEGLFVVIAQNC